MNSHLVCLPDLVTRQIDATPQATAVVRGVRSLTYATLGTRANQLAHRLRERGVGPGSVVAVSLPRGFELVVALLAVWKAGGAYLPLDPDAPAARRAFMLADTAADLVLTDSGPAAFEGWPVVTLDPQWSVLDGCPETDPAVTIDPDSAAYAIYTSGSTGQPKGVLVTHRGIANRVDWTVRRHGLGPADRVLQKTSLGFDAACWEFFAPLRSGGTVVLAEPGAERDPTALVLAIAQHQVTVLQGVPSVLRLLAEEPGWSDCTSLRLLFSAGEALHAELGQRLVEGLKVELWNTYGPTECAIDVTAHPFDPVQATGPVPIGKPIDNIRVLVLDDIGEPVPVGVAGELYAGGAGVARGYVGRPAHTADRFVPDPYGVAGSRLYRTGDQVRWRADGTLEYLGRLDAQIKVHGVRVEPGEVEAALAAHPAVIGAVVTAVADPAGTKRLAAYVRGRRELAPDELRRFLLERLPEVLVPTVFVAMDTFPLTATGKVDRAALPAPDPAEASGSVGYVAPRTDEERLVARVWCAVLGVERVGVHDDFFALGGTSLVLTRLASQLKVASGGDVALRGLFSAATVEAQARLIAVGRLAAASVDPGAEGQTTRASAPTADQIAVVAADRPLVLSPGQHRLWFLDRLRPGSPEWVAPMHLRLPATASADTVRRALGRLEARHEALRTRYPDQSGEPVQVIVGPSDVELRVVDAAETELVELFGEQFRRGFDLARGPLWRALLVRMPGQDHVLLVTMHHIACDGWSTVVLERELRELCDAQAQSREPVLPDLPVRYADYAAWRQAQVTEEALADDLGYWRETLAGMAPLELPLDRPRAAQRDPSGSGVHVTLPPDLGVALTELGRSRAATPFMTLLAGFAAVLARYSGQWDIPVGTPVAGRGRPELDNVVGFFLNSLVLRCGLAGDLSFLQAVDRVKAVTLGAFAHQDVPFERLVDEHVAHRDLSRTPLYQVAFDLQDEGVTSVVAADEVAMNAFQRAWSVAKTDVTLFMWRRPDGAFSAAFEYASALFDQATMTRLAEHFVALLRAVVADPHQPLSTVNFLGAPERTRLLDGYNDSARDWAPGTVLELFESQARQTPAAVAVRYQERSQTYAELDRRADQVARLLRRHGAGPESVVAVLLERGPDLLAVLLGVWKAGAAYLPLDPSYPAARIAGMLADAGVTVAMTSQRYADRFEVRTLLIESDVDAAGDAAAVPTPARRDPDALAYTIFTSGSTGRPKGVLITHRGLANHIRWAAEHLAARGTGGAPVFSSVAFDLVVPNLWAPLVTGQAVTLMPAERDVADLGRWLHEQAPFSFIKLTPGHLDVLSHQLDERRSAGLAAVIVVAGEALPGPLASHWARILGPGRLINEYGPTEASVGTCVYPVDAPTTAEVVPIGYPLPNLRMYVLDRGLRPVPLGVIGELCVGGTGVARGYAGRPDLTADRFLPDPYGEPGARLYRTGDLVRRLADGAVDFVGREDNQVKIRGYRIEPDEVTAVLLTHPSVRSAVVVAHQGATGERRLVAYVVPASGSTAEAGELAVHCAQLLPDYLIPAQFIEVAEIPLNANAKVDRAALPDPDLATPAAAEVLVAPRNAAEERIAAIWRDLLGVEIGVHHNFFGLGGHSILAVRLISRLQEEFDIELAVRVVFERPTVAGQAEAVEEQIRAEIDALDPADLAAARLATPPATEHPAATQLAGDIAPSASTPHREQHA